VAFGAPVLRMKAAFYLLDGDSNASSYHRALQYFPLLRQHGIEPSAARPVPRSAYERLVERGGTGSASGLPKKAALYSLFALCRTLDVQRAHRADVVAIQRDLFPFGPPVLERMLLRRNPNLVYDTDDATYLRPSFTPNTPFQRLRRFDKVAEVVGRARWVSVATDPIAAWARQYNQRVSVVPMAVDPRTYDVVRQARVSTRTAHHGGRLVLGWAGTAGGLRYLHALLPVLRKVSDKYDVEVRVVSGGFRGVQLPGVAVEAQPWRGIDQLGGFDIGLLPLDDSPFERAKFPFKLLQYWALGLPVVSARVGIAAEVIEHGVNGLLASSAEEWLAALACLLADSALRARLAEAGRETVADRYTIERIGPLLVDGLMAAAR
jgi:glycosyltransferase involved in cell wall biosynthesis